jgi:hypothetical protein
MPVIEKFPRITVDVFKNLSRTRVFIGNGNDLSSIYAGILSNGVAFWVGVSVLQKEPDGDKTGHDYKAGISLPTL